MSVAREIRIDEVGYASSFLSKFSDLRKAGKHCDFVIKVQGKEIHAHRPVLIIKSEYFRGMLENDTVENRQGFVDMKDVEFIHMKKAVDFMYSGKGSVATEDIGGMIHLADLLQLDELGEGLGHLLAEDLTAESFFQTKKVADTYNCKGLGDKCNHFAFEKFEAIEVGEDFCHLEEAYVEFLINSAETNVAEIIKYKALVRWISFDNESRSHTFAKLLKCLDVANIPASFRRHIIENEPMAYESNECLLVFLRSFFETADVPSRSFELGRENAVAGFNSSSSSIVAYLPKGQVWEVLRKVGTNIAGCGLSRISFTVIILDRDIYVLCKDKRVFKLRYLNMKADWKKMASMLQNHGSYPPTVVFDGNIHVIGNKDVTDDQSSETYNPYKDEWSEVSFSSGFTRRKNYSLVTGGGYVFCIGGWSQPMTVSRANVRIYDTVEKLDPLKLTWSVAAPLNRARHQAGAASLGGNIYVTGGSDGRNPLQSVEVYDIDGNVWANIADMPGYVSEPSVVVVDGSLFVVGGSMVEKYDIEKKEWESLEYSGNRPDSNAGCVSLVC